MHLLVFIIIAVALAIYGKRTCNMRMFFIASLIAAALIGMEVQEGLDE